MSVGHQFILSYDCLAHLIDEFSLNLPYKFIRMGDAGASRKPQYRECPEGCGGTRRQSNPPYIGYTFTSEYAPHRTIAFRESSVRSIIKALQ